MFFKVEQRIAGLDQKIAALDKELLGYKQKMATARGPALNGLRQRAMRALKQKKM